MNVAIQVPIKARASTRVPNKNFLNLCGKPLSCWLLDELVAHCPGEWDIFIDCEDATAVAPIRARYGDRLKLHVRHEWFAGDAANGNHLLHQFATAQPDYDIYAQAFVTAVTLPGATVVEAVHRLSESLDEHDSALLVTEETGWFWFGGRAMNYTPDRPDGLPRSQDAVLLKETTGLYVVTREVVFTTGCRVGKAPLFHRVPREQALDIDTMEDLAEAQQRLSVGMPKPRRAAG